MRVRKKREGVFRRTMKRGTSSETAIVTVAMAAARAQGRPMRDWLTPRLFLAGSILGGLQCLFYVYLFSKFYGMFAQLEPQSIARHFPRSEHLGQVTNRQFIYITRAFLDSLMMYPLTPYIGHTDHWFLLLSEQGIDKQIRTTMRINNRGKKYVIISNKMTIAIKTKQKKQSSATR